MGNVHFAPMTVASATKLSNAGMTFSKIIYQTNSYRQVLSPSHVRVHIPGGFPYEAYNGKGYIRPWSILCLIENSRAASFARARDGAESFLNFTNLYHNYLMFIASTSTIICPKLYDMSFPKAPLDVHVELTYVGKTSYNLKTTVFLQGIDKDPLIENNTQAVCVSQTTRRPTPFPDWWKEQYLTIEGEPLKLPQLTVPGNGQIWKHRFEVRGSEVDAYMHVNWSNYIKYCYDAFVFSELKLKSQPDAKNVFRNVKKFSARFLKEASVGDSLDTQFWQDMGKPNLYYFQVMKDSDVICECTLEFFPTHML